MRGGNTQVDTDKFIIVGLSPHARGKLFIVPPKTTFLGSIPAYAGETLTFATIVSFYWVYPRIRGGNLREGIEKATLWGLSPHTRGKPAGMGNTNCLHGSIPAYAGETPST